MSAFQEDIGNQEYLEKLCLHVAAKTAAVEEKLKEARRTTERLVEKVAGEVRADATRALMGQETKTKSALQELRGAQAKANAELEAGQAKSEEIEGTLKML